MDVRTFATASEANAAALAELTREVRTQQEPVICFATGSTYAPIYAAIDAAVATGALELQKVIATHLDEYLEHEPETENGMVHEIVTRCPPLARLLARGRFWAVPSSGDPQLLRGHEARLATIGGISLVFLGIGRNGHIAFNEPGTPFEVGFHRTKLAETTREDARSRFAPKEPPREAVTAGLRTILGARRIVLVATGAGKAQAVRAMLEGPVTVSCPASALRQHGAVTVLLDAAAASALSLARREAHGS